MQSTQETWEEKSFQGLSPDCRFVFEHRNIETEITRSIEANIRQASIWASKIMQGLINGYPRRMRNQGR